MIGDKVSGKVLVSRLLTAVNDFMIDDYELPEGYVDMAFSQPPATVWVTWPLMMPPRWPTSKSLKFIPPMVAAVR